MHTYDKYWLTNLARGILALLASAGVAFLPPLIDSSLNRLLFLPFAISISILCLSLYAVLDSGFLVAIGCTIRKPRAVHWLAILHGLAGIALFAALIVYSTDGLNLRIFAYFAALQAFSLALAETILAIRAKHHQGMAWLLMCAGISLTCCVVLLLAGRLTAGDQARLIFGYLLLRGSSLTLLSLRMLYIEDSPSHRHGFWNAMTGGFKTKGQATV